ncbi:MAG: hypothetical protein AB1547_15035, partial [Thermodesulfobacteriota bacterium]
HEERCDVDRLTKWLELERTGETSRVSVSETLAFDDVWRRLTIERFRIDPDRLPFLFGRPLREMVQQLRRAIWNHRR